MSPLKTQHRWHLQLLSYSQRTSLLWSYLNGKKPARNRYGYILINLHMCWPNDARETRVQGLTSNQLALHLTLACCIAANLNLHTAIL